MAKTKAPKKKAAAQSSKQKSSGKQQGGQKQNKKKSWAKGNWDSGDHLSTELKAVGLRVKEVVGDGNCCFRAIGDQLEGDKADHRNIRKQVCQYIEDNEDMFAPFIEDDESFQNYLKRMRKDSTWAGQIELQAASLAFQVNICIYQYQQPRWTLSNFSDDGSNTIHISYHDGEHYNSVRKLDDYDSGPPEKVQIVASNETQISTDWNSPSEEDIQKQEIVSRNTGCQDQLVIRQALTKCRGNVDDAVEKVINQMAGLEDMDGVEEANQTTSNQNVQNSDQEEQSKLINNDQVQSDQNLCDHAKAMEIDDTNTLPLKQQQNVNANGIKQQQQQEQKSPNRDENSNDQINQQKNEMKIDQIQKYDSFQQNNAILLQNGIKLVEDYEVSDDEISPQENTLSQNNSQEINSQQQNNQLQDQQNLNTADAEYNGKMEEENSQQEQKIVNGKLQNGNVSEDDKKSKKSKKQQKKDQKNDLSNQKKYPRNKPCHCGSGRKYKNCHGPIDLARKRRGEEGQISEDEKISEKIQVNSVYLQDVVSL